MRRCGTGPPIGAVTATGQLLRLANQPIRNRHSVRLGKVYGVRRYGRAWRLSYTAAGLQSVANAYTDTLATVTTGTASVTSTGSVATATVADRPTAITAATGDARLGPMAMRWPGASPAFSPDRPAATITASRADQGLCTAIRRSPIRYTGLVNGDVLTGALATTATGHLHRRRLALRDHSRARSQRHLHIQPIPGANSPSRWPPLTAGADRHRDKV